MQNESFTVLARNVGGTMRKYVLEDSSLCPGYEFYDIQPGLVTKEELLLRHAGGSDVLTYLVRFLCFFMVWVALCIIIGPCKAVPLDSILPGIADSEGRLDDCAAISCISFCPTFGTIFGVVGAVWVNERPVVGLPWVIVGCLLRGAL